MSEPVSPDIAQAARSAGFLPQVFWHTTDKEFTVFNTQRRMYYFGTEPVRSSVAALCRHGTAKPYFLHSSRPYNTPDDPIPFRDAEAFEVGKTPEVQSHVYAAAESFLASGETPEAGVLSKIYPNDDIADITASIAAATGEPLPDRVVRNIFESTGADLVYVKDEGGVSVAVASPNQIKSADPICYDDEGHEIPLDHRFDITSPDLRGKLPCPDGNIEVDFA